MARKKWIGRAIKHPGALRKKAERAGKSTAAFAREREHDSGTTGEQSRLSETLGRMRNRKKVMRKRTGRRKR